VKDLIITGDSFCASDTGWPGILADQLNLNLVSQGFPGHHWWKAKRYLDSVDTGNSESIVIVHTNATRIPTEDSALVTFDHSQEPTNELELSVKLYNKYISNPEFLEWAQQQWFAELETQHENIIHLHSFPWSVNYGSNARKNIEQNLCALSLNELGAKEFSLFNDTRPNHLNEFNNLILASQLAEIIQGDREQLDAQEFEALTDKWFSWH